MSDDGLMAACAAIARIERAARRNRLRQETAEALRIAKAARAAGFPVRGATIGGIPFAFGEAEKATASTPLEQWKEKRRARQA